ncbi:MAG: efflux RND transporter periplasmic adaptor subunit, partial [Pseudomonadota bacterium]
MTEPKSLPLWRRVVRHVFVLTGTAATAALAIFLATLGTETIATNAADVEPADPVPPLPVETVELVPETSFEIPVEYLGLVEPRRSADLGFEAGGTLAEVLVDEGDFVGEGSVVARLDTRALEAEKAAQVAARNALKAERDLAELTAERQKRLASDNFSSQQRADEAVFALAALEARIAQAEAGIAAVDIQLDKSTLRAPFDGIVASRMADEGRRLAGGTPVIELLENTAPEFRVGLPSDVAAEISAKGAAEVQIGTSVLMAQPTGMRTDIDPVTRTVPVLFTLADSNDAVFGAVGRLLHTRTQNADGAWVPVSALSEGERG